MGLWILGGIVAVLLLAVVVAALRYGRFDEVAPPEIPDWSLPTPRELASADFPLAWQGYDPDHVDAWVEGVRRAHEELWAALGPSGIADLQERIDAARGTGGTAADDDTGEIPAHGSPTPDEPLFRPGPAVASDQPEPAEPMQPGEQTQPGEPTDPARRVIPKVTVDDDRP